MSRKIERTCERCGKPFMTKPSRLKKGWGRFCSVSCSLIKPKVECICEHCGKTFETYPSETKRGGGRYCSPECNYKAKNFQIERTCEHCGNRFFARRSTVEAGNGRFCSRKCTTDSQFKQIKRACEYCGKIFGGLPCKVKENHDRFCSKECFYLYQTENNAKVTCTCQTCGKIFKTYPAEIKRGGGKVCSKECYGPYLSQNYSGPNSSLWKGGTIDYYGPGWRLQRREALKRDSYTCQYCGKKKPKSKNHQVHHITPFRAFGYIQGENENHEQANKLTNLITLCASCHRKAESGKIFIQPRLL